MFLHVMLHIPEVLVKSEVTEDDCDDVDIDHDLLEGHQLLERNSVV